MKQLTVVSIVYFVTIRMVHSGEQIYAPEFIGQSQLSQEYFLFSDSSPETQFEGWPTCRHGQWQSPIDISEPLDRTDLKLEFSQNYYDPLLKVGLNNNNGHYRKYINVLSLSTLNQLSHSTSYAIPVRPETNNMVQRD